MASLRPLNQVRGFSTSSSRHASILFALQSLSNSRETQHFNKLSKLDRVEHSPSLKLIQTSEVDPYPSTEKAKPVAPVAAPIEATEASRIWDAKALQVGRTILAENARQVAGLTKALDQARRSQQEHTAKMEKEMDSWAKERQRMRHEMRSAGTWILISVGTATGLAMWRFWPEKGRRDATEIAREITERASRANAGKAAALIPAPAIASEAAAPTIAPVPTTPKTNLTSTSSDVPIQQATPSRAWWKSLFWKQQ